MDPPRKQKIPSKQQLFNYLSDEDVLKLDSSSTRRERYKDGGFMNGLVPLKKESDTIYGNGDLMRIPKRLLDINAGTSLAFPGNMETYPLSASNDVVKSCSHREVDLINFCKDDYTLGTQNFHQPFNEQPLTSVWQRTGSHDNPTKFSAKFPREQNFERGSEKMKESFKRKKESKNEMFPAERNPPLHFKPGSRTAPNIDVSEYKVFDHVAEGEYENLQSERDFHSDAVSMTTTMTRHRQISMPTWDEPHASIRHHHHHHPQQQQHRYHHQQQQQLHYHQHFINNNNNNLSTTNSHLTMKEATLKKSNIFIGSTENNTTTTNNDLSSFLSTQDQQLQQQQQQQQHSMFLQQHAPTTTATTTTTQLQNFEVKLYNKSNKFKSNSTTTTATTSTLNCSWRVASLILLALTSSLAFILLFFIASRYNSQSRDLESIYEGSENGYFSHDLLPQSSSGTFKHPDVPPLSFSPPVPLLHVSPNTFKTLRFYLRKPSTIVFHVTFTSMTLPSLTSQSHSVMLAVYLRRNLPPTHVLHDSRHVILRRRHVTRGNQSEDSEVDTSAHLSVNSFNSEMSHADRKRVEEKDKGTKTNRQKSSSSQHNKSRIISIQQAGRKVKSQLRLKFDQSRDVALLKSDMMHIDGVTKYNERNADEDDEDGRSLKSNSFHGATSKRRERRKRSLTEKAQNSSTAFMDILHSGLWYISLYNDATQDLSLSIHARIQKNSTTSKCPLNCRSRGLCVAGRCLCLRGFQGVDCGKTTCPGSCSEKRDISCAQSMPSLPPSTLPSSSSSSSLSSSSSPSSSSPSLSAPPLSTSLPSMSGEPSNIMSPRPPSSSSPSLSSSSSSSPSSSSSCRDVTCGGGRGICLNGECMCSPGFSGENCSEEICHKSCLNGQCTEGECECFDGWQGETCNLLRCSTRCAEHGDCHNGTCVCEKGWNGKHCTLNGCFNGCHGRGSCEKVLDSWKCVCRHGYKGVHCSVSMETHCSNNNDDDNDALKDCQDPDCCMDASCKESPLCATVPNPIEILLRKQPASSSSPFYERMKFLIEENSVQIYATTSSFNSSQVSVVRGKVVTSDGSSIMGVKVTVVTQPLYGFTMTRDGGLFDILVNGGGSVILNFERQPFKASQVNVTVPWNRMVVMETVVLLTSLEGGDDDDDEGNRSLAIDQHHHHHHYRRSKHLIPNQLTATPPECHLVHDRYTMKPEVLSEQVRESLDCSFHEEILVTGDRILQDKLKVPGTSINLVYRSSRSLGFLSSLRVKLTPDLPIPDDLHLIHLRVEVEGVLHEKQFEAEANLIYKFDWDKRNSYNQKVHGAVPVTVSVGYEYNKCDMIFWEKQTSEMTSYDVTEVGGWNVDIYHAYNFQQGILHKGDGTNHHLKNSPWRFTTILGDGKQRGRECKGNSCDKGLQTTRLYAPVALAGGRDSSLYIGDYNMVLKLGANREDVAGIFQLRGSDIPYKYFITLSPMDGKLYIADHQSLKIVRVKTMGPVRELTNNFEDIAGTGEQCYPGDPDRCGDGGPAIKAKLNYPKGIAINKDGTIFFADGTNVRMIDEEGNIWTLVGSQGQPKYWRPILCQDAVPMNQVTLHWPTSLSINPLDDTLHVLDNHSVLKVTMEKTIVVVAGRPLHCPLDGKKEGIRGGDKRKRDIGGRWKFSESNQFRRSTSSEFNSNFPNGDIEWQSGIEYDPSLNDDDDYDDDDVDADDDDGEDDDDSDVLYDDEDLNDADGVVNDDGELAVNVRFKHPIHIAFSPAGDLYVVESNARDVNRVRKVDTVGRIWYYAGKRVSDDDCKCHEAEQQPAIDPHESGKAYHNHNKCPCHPNVGDGLATQLHLKDPTSVAVTPDNVLHIADMGNYKVHSILPSTPLQDRNGHYEVTDGNARESYVFNRYGQHIFTKDLATNRILFNFTYNVNSYHAKLVKITDSFGNTLVLNRDYKSQVKELVLNSNKKCQLIMDSKGMLQTFYDSTNQTIKFTYKDNGLLASKETNEGSIIEYDYLADGRLASISMDKNRTMNLERSESCKSENSSRSKCQDPHDTYRCLRIE